LLILALASLAASAACGLAAATPAWVERREGSASDEWHVEPSEP
jgi:hypothetical protein